MLLIVGLGNPGSDHAGQRHNLGFMALDRIHSVHGFSPWRSRFHSLAADGQLAGVKCLLLKPATYYNESGRAVAEAMRFHKLAPDDVVVIHDEIALAPGKIRVKTGGGSAGNNGIKSVDAHIGPDFRRVRLGIGHPGDKDLVHGFVLHAVSKAERQWLDPLLDAVADHAAALAQKRDDQFMNKVTLATRPAGTDGQEG
jgi:PTH1 family peptidyl-tRNA hydrolase